MEWFAPMNAIRCGAPARHGTSGGAVKTCEGGPDIPKLNRSFFDRFHDSYSEDISGCWLWMASCSSTGYGQFWTGRRNSLAHRLSYEIFHAEPIPDGLTIDHLCRVRACVNPGHLETVTQRENTLRGVGLSAQNARKTHCHRGHAFVEENIYRRPGGHRECRRCMNGRWKKENLT